MTIFFQIPPPPQIPGIRMVGCIALAIYLFLVICPDEEQLTCDNLKLDCKLEATKVAKVCEENYPPTKEETPCKIEFLAQIEKCAEEHKLCLKEHPDQINLNYIGAKKELWFMLPSFLTYASVVCLILISKCYLFWRIKSGLFNKKTSEKIFSNTLYENTPLHLFPENPLKMPHFTLFFSKQISRNFGHTSIYLRVILTVLGCTFLSDFLQIRFNFK